MKKGTDARSVTEFETIRVVTTGKRDKVFWKHNGKHIFTITCGDNGDSRLHLSRWALAESQTEWDRVYHQYGVWKRKKLPRFKLPNHSGLSSGGKVHPFRLGFYAHQRTDVRSTGAAAPGKDSPPATNKPGSHGGPQPPPQRGGSRGE